MDAIQSILGIIGKVDCMVLKGREIRDTFLACTLGRQLSEGLLTGGTQSEKIWHSIRMCGELTLPIPYDH